MGTWGPGNFENDTAAEYLIDLCKPLVQQIKETVAEPELMQPDEYDSDIMLANIEILTILAENISRYETGWVGEMVFPFPFPEQMRLSNGKLHISGSGIGTLMSLCQVKIINAQGGRSLWLRLIICGV